MRNEHGAMSIGNAATALGGLIVVVATVWAALQSSAAVSAIQKDDEVDSAKQQCTTAVLFDTVDALNQRTQFTSEQAQANVELQKSQLPLIRAIGNPNVSDEQATQIVQDYLNALEDFLAIAAKTTTTQEQNPYPTIKGYTSCLADASDGELEKQP